uniref:Fibroblast growth factor 10a n=1 Tax=Cyprinus carpio TaxID=7962 RepID=A0A8C2AH72_CYPCA
MCKWKVTKGASAWFRLSCLSLPLLLLLLCSALPVACHDTHRAIRAPRGTNSSLSAVVGRHVRSYNHLTGDVRKRKLFSYQKFFLRIDQNGELFCVYHTALMKKSVSTQEPGAHGAQIKGPSHCHQKPMTGQQQRCRGFNEKTCVSETWRSDVPRTIKHPSVIYDLTYSVFAPVWRADKQLRVPECKLEVLGGLQLLIKFGNHYCRGTLEIKSVDVGIVAIKGIQSNYYLAINKKGVVYGAKDFGVDCKLIERIEENRYNTYASAEWRNRKKPMFVGLMANGKPMRAKKTRRKNTATHFLPIPIV